ncbi:hypothetical protein [Rickettsia endosymbiont of Polydrusus tereticollis]|uniref:hypothetical protein n=1 Tax=Rickettsia endosymbiont of Polydrusus tereticollis TaxID=3066251 RepID=UPI003132DD8A
MTPKNSSHPITPATSWLRHDGLGIHATTSIKLQYDTVRFAKIRATQQRLY